MPLWIGVIVVLLVPGLVWMAGDWLGADPHEAAAMTLAATTGAALVFVESGGGPPSRGRCRGGCR